MKAKSWRYALKRAKHSAPGEDAISYEMMKQVPERYIETLAELYSISLMMGKLPRTWKEIIIIPIPKKDKDIDHTDQYPFYLSKAISRWK